MTGDQRGAGDDPATTETARADERQKRVSLSGMPLRAMVPNTLTLIALSAGVTSIRFAIEQEWERAALAIVVAGIIDGFDGAVARLLKGTTRFGAELDSLADMTNFGVAPALVIYLWALESLGRIGWVIALAYVVGCALRLARFNAQVDMQNQPHKRAGFLTGVPAPVAAGLALFPLFVDLTNMGHDLRSPEIVALQIALVTLLMVSSVPTFSFRAFRIRRGARIAALGLVGLLIAMLLSFPWATLSAISLAYLCSMPVSWVRYRRRKARTF
ncbi:MAG: phosphatidylcholine/phosphatidylserine synthase [Pseudomonadota bacterium]